MQHGEARCAKLASQQAPERLPEQQFRQRLLDKQAEGRAREEECSKAAGVLLLCLDVWSHLLFVAPERLLVGGGFAQCFGQQIGSCHSKGCSMPREQRGTVAGVTEEGNPGLSPGGHLNLEDGIHEDVLRWVSIGEEMLCEPTCPCKYLTQTC